MNLAERCNNCLRVITPGELIVRGWPEDRDFPIVTHFTCPDPEPTDKELNDIEVQEHLDMVAACEMEEDYGG